MRVVCVVLRRVPKVINELDVKARQERQQNNSGSPATLATREETLVAALAQQTLFVLYQTPQGL